MQKLRLTVPATLLFLSTPAWAQHAPVPATSPAPASTVVAPPPAVAPTATPSAFEGLLKKLDGSILKDLAISGYVQVQFLAHSFNDAASPNLVDGALPSGVGANDTVAKADGTTTNATYFRLRRTRLRLKYESERVRVFLQFDPAPAGGPSATQGTIVRNAEATGIIRWNEHTRTELGAGLFQVPFRFEILESSMMRPFIERTWTSQCLFPTERDLGAYVRTFALDDRLVAEAAIVNGQRLGEPHFVELADLNRSKDGVARIAYKAGPLTLGVFGYVGMGQRVDTKTLRVKDMPRSAVNFGVTFAKKLLSVGETRAYSELMFGKNMDTGVRYGFAVPAIPASPSANLVNQNERSLYVRLEQDITPWGLVGFRYDTYSPNTSLTHNARDTYTVMAGAKFDKYLRLIAEGTHVTDNARAVGGDPAGKRIESFTAWLQGSFY